MSLQLHRGVIDMFVVASVLMLYYSAYRASQTLSFNSLRFCFVAYNFVVVFQLFSFVADDNYDQKLLKTKVNCLCYK